MANERPKRACAPRIDYSQTKQRAPRKRKAEPSKAYMDASNGAARGRTVLGKAIAIGDATVERIVGQAYEWRDAAYAKKRRVVFDDGG